MTVNRTEHYSGIHVVTLPGRLEDCAHELDAITGVTVSVRDDAHDRMIVVLEADTRADLEALHRRVRAVGGVVLADPVVHYVDEDPDLPAHDVPPT